MPIIWTKFSIVNNFTGAHRVCLYDLEGDDDLDILAAAYTLNQIAWFRNDGGNPIHHHSFPINDGIVYYIYLSIAMWFFYINKENYADEIIISMLSAFDVAI